MKTLSIWIFILACFDVQCQKVQIDTVILNQDSAKSFIITKTYNYRLYRIDSLWMNSKLISNYKIEKLPGELSKIYLDSLSKTSPFIGRRKLPIDRLPDEFYIFNSNIITGDWCRIINRSLIYFDKTSKREIIIYNKNTNGNSKPDYRCKIYPIDSIKPLINKLNNLIIWDSINKYSVPYGQIYSTASREGSINLTFKYKDDNFKNSFDISLVTEYGMSYELRKIIAMLIDKNFESGVIQIDTNQINKDKMYNEVPSEDILLDIKKSELVNEDASLMKFLDEIR